MKKKFSKKIIGSIITIFCIVLVYLIFKAYFYCIFLFHERQQLLVQEYTVSVSDLNAIKESLTYSFETQASGVELSDFKLINEKGETVQNAITEAENLYIWDSIKNIWTLQSFEVLKKQDEEFGRIPGVVMYSPKWMMREIRSRKNKIEFKAIERCDKKWCLVYKISDGLSQRTEWIDTSRLLLRKAQNDLITGRTHIEEYVYDPVTISVPTKFIRKQ